MTASALHRHLIVARSSITGDFSSTSRIVDTLLDVRQLCDAESDIAALVDSILAAIPGRSVVTNEWWTARLDELEDQIAGDNPSACIPVTNG